MKRYLRNIFFFSLPLVSIIIGYYVISDPFMTIRLYDDYWPQYGRQCHNDVVRAVRLMDKYDDSLHYNSFIIGNSRSDFYYVDDWKQYLREDASCFHFNQSADDLYGTLQRIRYLYNRFHRIDNLLIIVDADYLRDMSKHTGHLYRIPAVVTGNPLDEIVFRIEEMRAFYNLDFQKSWIRGEVPNSNNGTTSYNPYLNEVYKDAAEKHITTMSIQEYNETLSSELRLYQRSRLDSVAPRAIFERQEAALKEIAEYVKKGDTEVKIIVSPLYDQIKINPEDIKILKTIYGESNVWDFSGINKYTDNVKNYYENSHYRPMLCRELLRVIYEEMK